MTVDLRPAAGDSGLFDVWGHGVKIGAVRLVLDGPAAKMAAQVDVTPVVERQDIIDFLLATVERAQRAGATDIEFHSVSLLLRHEARRIGFRGGLRVPLTALVRDVVPPRPDDEPALNTGERTAWLVGALLDLGLASSAVRRSGPIGRLTTRLTGGVGDTVSVMVPWAPGRSFTISAPDRADVMPESIALTGATAVAVLSRFPDQAAAVRAIRFDRAVYELKTGRYSGMTEGSSPSIHLNVGFVIADDSLAGLHRRKGKSSRTPSASPPPPYTSLEATVAHELWHKIESAFEVRHYRTSMELRRRVGLDLGVETLEHAVKGASAKAPANWQAAHRRLVEEVSPYAVTNVREATAELFKLWWCRDGSSSPVVTRFGELVDELLPPTVGAS